MRITIVAPEELESKRQQLLRRAAEILTKQSRYNYTCANKLSWVRKELKKLEDKLGGQ